MDLLSRDELRKQALEPLFKTQALLAIHLELLSSSKTGAGKELWSTKIEREAEKLIFLLKAVGGEPVKGEDGWEESTEPSSSKESVIKHEKWIRHSGSYVGSPAFN